MRLTCLQTGILNDSRLCMLQSRKQRLRACTRGFGRWIEVERYMQQLSGGISGKLQSKEPLYAQTL